MSAEASTWVRWDRPKWPVAGFLSGLLLTIPNALPLAAPLQMIAFVPLLVALRRIERWRTCLFTGFLMGMGFIGPQLLILQLPPLISLILVAYFVAVLMVLVAVSWRVVRPVSVGGCVTFGALVAIVDWVVVTALPMWGTAQSFGRCWSSYPRLIAFTCATGMTGILFVLGMTQSLAVLAIQDRRRRLACILVFLGFGVVIGVVDYAAVPTVNPELRVAAVGWTDSREHGGPGSPEGFARLYAEPVAEAARRGARLVVSPETGFAVYDDPEGEPFERFLALAREHDVYLAVGYMDNRSGENRVVFLGPEEGVMGRYAKHHLTPFEDYPRGDGQPVLVTIDGFRIGALICHDDNYTDIARRYGREGTDVLVIPTNDWRPVRRAHFQSTIHRAIELRCPLVRAASNGISAIISVYGTVLAVRDHCREGPGLVIADVSIFSARTIFARWGNWFAVVCGVLLVVHVLWRKRNE
jgi:apolipoprotein N-acyltransferase